MKLKLTIALAAIAFICAPTMAQQKLNFAVRGGINFQNIRGTDAGDNKMHNKMKNGFHAGIDLQIPLGVDFFLQPGLLYTTKGTKLETTGNEVSLSYIEMPVFVVHSPKVGNGLKYGRIMLGLGGYLATGVEGTYQSSNGETHQIAFRNGGNEPTTLVSYGASCRKFDYGASGLLGYSMSSGIFLQLNGQIGFAKVNAKTDDAADHTSWRNGGFGLSMGYRF